ncbi:MAG: diaminopimelate epimerase [Nitrospirae bacterium]|nr:diaminopimelate epimerase [Nitrospirota bacterium]
MAFIKMHGLGNDFILIDCCERKLKIENSKFKILAKNLCNRRFGIGADQLLLLYPSEIADYKMRIFNVDGSEVEMCGNGIRCLAKYIWDKNLSNKNILSIETLAGIIKPERADDMIRVDMGEPVFEAEKIPIKILQNPKFKVQSYKEQEVIIDYPLKIEDNVFYVTCLSMGNPHAVIILEDLSEFPVSFYGPLIENNHLFPKRTNVEFVEVINTHEVKVRVWERGSGETLACGTGASAVGVATTIKGVTGRVLTVHLAGGDLMIEWAEDNHVYMTGPATKVFEGIIEIKY